VIWASGSSRETEITLQMRNGRLTRQAQPSRRKVAIFLEAGPAPRPRPVVVERTAVHYEVQASENSLFGALVVALLETMRPDARVTQVPQQVAPNSATDVVVENTVTGRKLVVFGSTPARQSVADALAQGAYSLIGVVASRDELTMAIASLQEGPAYVCASIVKALALDETAGSEKIYLTERELEVVRLVMDGNSNREIALTLCVSPNTVRSHLQSIFDKFAVNSRAKLAARARALGFR
jgi:two-component system, NarL family, response regulator LiaR